MPSTDRHLFFRPARPEELSSVVALYHAAGQEPFSVWDENYPTEADARHDLETGNLYVLFEENPDGNGRVIGTLSVCPENEMDDLPGFTVNSPGVRELARIAVASDRHGQGYAATMVTLICDILARRGVPALRISVARDNLPARRTYPRVGFCEIGEASLFGGSYVLMEKVLEPN